MKGDILIVDDEGDICDLVAGILNDEGYTTRTAQNTEQAWQACLERFPQCIILDIWLKESQMDGLQLCAKIKKQQHQTPVIMMSGHGTIELAVEAMKLGAYNFLTKPFRADNLLHLVEKSLIDAKKHQIYQMVASENAKNNQFFLGNSDAISELNAKIEKASNNNARVLISGQYGTNQNLIAKTIGQLTNKSNIIICHAANPDHMDQLFGNDHNPVGLLEKCHHGILLLLDIQFLSAEIQEKLWQFMNQGHFTRQHDNALITIDARIISTISLNANETPADYCSDKFLTRLASTTINAPMLSDRIGDLPELCHYYLQKIGDIFAIKPPEIAEESLAMIKNMLWQKNYWHLFNMLELIVIQNPYISVITAHNIQQLQNQDELLPNWALDKNYKHAMGEFERRFINASLQKFQGHVSKTAEFLGMDRATLHRKLPK